MNHLARMKGELNGLGCQNTLASQPFMTRPMTMTLMLITDTLGGNPPPSNSGNEGLVRDPRT